MIIYTKLARWMSGGNGGIALWPFAFIVPELKHDKEIHNHEQIHLAQQRELWVIPFYILYVLFWVQGLLRRDVVAYLSIPFEREAYTNQDDPYYLGDRKRFAWVGYR
tara:strand:- start:1546 stop:1866 length:321 start_codon:yes stop_codon:yes gene_type:complete